MLIANSNQHDAVARLPADDQHAQHRGNGRTDQTLDEDVEPLGEIVAAPGRAPRSADHRVAIEGKEQQRDQPQQDHQSATWPMQTGIAYCERDVQSSRRFHGHQH